MTYTTKALEDRLAAIAEGFEARQYSTYQRDGWTLNLSVVPVVNDDDLIAITIIQDGIDGKTFMIETEELRAMLREIGIMEGAERARVCPTEPWDT